MKYNVNSNTCILVYEIKQIISILHFLFSLDDNIEKRH